MGLDVSHDAWSGAYGAFNRWRIALAKAAGYSVAKIGDDFREDAIIDWGHAVEKNFYGEWDSVPCNLTGPDPLLILLVHSDCEGHIEPEHCTLLADRLEELLPGIDDGMDGGGHLGNVRATTQRFIAGCRDAVDLGERLEFS